MFRGAKTEIFLIFHAQLVLAMSVFIQQNFKPTTTVFIKAFPHLLLLFLFLLIVVDRLPDGQERVHHAVEDASVAGGRHSHSGEARLGMTEAEKRAPNSSSSSLFPSTKWKNPVLFLQGAPILFSVSDTSQGGNTNRGNSEMRKQIRNNKTKEKTVFT